MSDFCITITSKYNDIYLACATINKPFRESKIDEYIGQVFNAMINLKLVTNPNESMIAIIINESRNTSKIVVIERDHNVHMIKTDIKNLIKSTMKHEIIGSNFPAFIVDYDEKKPILCYNISKMELATIGLYNQIYGMIASDELDSPISFITTKNLNN